MGARLSVLAGSTARVQQWWPQQQPRHVKVGAEGMEGTPGLLHCASAAAQVVGDQPRRAFPVVLVADGSLGMYDL